MPESYRFLARKKRVPDPLPPLTPFLPVVNHAANINSPYSAHDCILSHRFRMKKVPNPFSHRWRNRKRGYSVRPAYFENGGTVEKPIQLQPSPSSVVESAHKLFLVLDRRDGGMLWEKAKS